LAKINFTDQQPVSRRQSSIEMKRSLAQNLCHLSLLNETLELGDHSGKDQNEVIGTTPGKATLGLAQGIKLGFISANKNFKFWKPAFFYVT
jgi:hypothetical protein